MYKLPIYVFQDGCHYCGKVFLPSGKTPAQHQLQSHVLSTHQKEILEERRQRERQEEEKRLKMLEAKRQKELEWARRQQEEERAKKEKVGLRQALFLCAPFLFKKG